CFLGKLVELHGDRAGYDDPAIVSGIGSIEGRSYMFVGHSVTGEGGLGGALAIACANKLLMLENSAFYVAR
ncbi:acetyl-coenzyme a carboxylase carboxyl transferase subunit alpha chloroplastic, partial [Phtheirospermum japonicum]